MITMYCRIKMLLTRISQFTISEHRNDDQQIPQHVDYSGEDEHAGQQCYGPSGACAGDQHVPDVSHFPEVPDVRGVF